MKPNLIAVDPLLPQPMTRDEIADLVRRTRDNSLRIGGEQRARAAGVRWRKRSAGGAK